VVLAVICLSWWLLGPLLLLAAFGVLLLALCVHVWWFLGR
jgi:hypothetical protein